MEFKTLLFNESAGVAAITLNRPDKRNAISHELIGDLLRALEGAAQTESIRVNGAAIAGGCAIATLCDFTLASHEAKFGYTEVRIGFVPAIVSSFLIWQIGEKHARDLLLTGRILDAEEAHRLGLVNQILPPDQVMPCAREIARVLMENSPVSLRATKKLLAGYTRDALERQVSEAIQENAWIRTTEDFREGIAAFLEKRKPVWKGK